MPKKYPNLDEEAKKYENPIPGREFILEHLEERGRPASRRQLIEELKLTRPEEQEALRRRLIAMVRDGQLYENRRGAYGPIAKMELIAGHIIGHKDGFGFVAPDDGSEDLFVGPRQMRLVFHGDRVLARISAIDSRGRREAIIVEVLEHNTTEIVGRYYADSDAGYVKSVNKRISHELIIPQKAHGKAKDGQMVIASLTAQPTLQTRPIGKIVEILGDHMAPGMEINVAIRNHGLPQLWPEAVFAETASFPEEVPEEALEGRCDLRSLPFVTIDGEDAKDFDDAVFCEPKADGGFILQVAIADVSYYVKPASSLDQEALNRGNSVYFPGRVIPMLPEVLSNNLCSLKPQVNRLVLVCKMTINAKGRVTDYSFFEGVIHSKARLTYKQVYAMGVQKDKHLQESYRELLPAINNLFDLYHILRQAREKRGAIDFDFPETQIIFGANRKIKEVIPLIRNDAHRLIEECMVAANICAAQFLLAKGYPALYRDHEPPSVDKLNDLRRFLSELGIKLSTKKDPVPADFAAILNSIADRPDAHLIQTMLLRSLSQAVYSPINKGHFGLACEAYTHFTSPIRRYPDLLVHRGIRSILQNKGQAETLSAFEKWGEHCSTTERRADEATREAVDWLKCEFIMDRVGETFDGIISGVTGFGLFVELSGIYVEGLVHISTLPNDYYHFNSMKLSLEGERSRKQYRLGDPIRVRVARVNLDEREIDFVVLEERSPVKKANKKQGKDKKS
ncbi:MAG TPA: ribonuclease R, partial [Gammaproteobacteria bacterium]|nr:ribonuclease R [Gammaproteobacteria bacterium]